jgi:hypothetical protein
MLLWREQRLDGLHRLPAPLGREGLETLRGRYALTVAVTVALATAAVGVVVVGGVGIGVGVGASVSVCVSHARPLLPGAPIGPLLPPLLRLCL